jgi:hypothetical protein
MTRSGVLRRVVGPVVALAALTGCGITRIDAPISFSADRSLSIQHPRPEDEVGLPLEMRWSAGGVDLSDGSHFALFVDRPPVPPDREVRQRVCTEGEKLPPQLGEFRKQCKDDRLTVFFTNRPSFRFSCFVPRFDAPKRARNTHTVTVVLLDADGRRIGQAADSVKFDVDDADASRCRGL